MKPQVTEITAVELAALIRRTQEELARAPKEDVTWYLHRLASFERMRREMEAQSCDPLH